MKSKFFTSIMMLYALTMLVGAQSFERQWDMSNATESTPEFFEGFFTRGIAATPNYLFIASRHESLSAQKKAVIYLDPKTGDPLGQLNVSTIMEEEFAVNDVQVSDDGQILVSKVSLGAQADPTKPLRSWQFKVHKWTDVDAVPTLYIDYANPHNLRLGDMITVKGDLTKNAVIYAGDYNKTDNLTRVVRWEVVDGVLNETPEIIVLVGLGEGSIQFPKVIPTGVTKNDPFYHNTTGLTLKKFSADGTTILEEIVPANFLASNGVEGRDNTITEFFVDGQHYIAALAIQGTGANNPAEVKAINVTNGLNAAIDPFHSQSLGGATKPNAQLSGNITSTVIDGEVWVFLLYGNAGFAAHKFIAPLPEVVVPVTEDGWRRGSNPDLDDIDGRLSKPEWLDATSRAVAVGNGHIYVVNCAEGGPGEIRVLDAANGSYLNKRLDVGLLNDNPTAGNKIRIADVEVDDAGHILACNMRMGEPLYIYAWDDEDSAPYILAKADGIPFAAENNTEAIWHQTAYYFDVKGDIKNDAVIIAARSNMSVTYRWVITGGVVQNGGDPTVTINNVTAGAGNFGPYAAATLESADPESPIWVSAASHHPTRFLADGTNKGTIPDEVAAGPTGYNTELTRSAKYLEWEGKKYIFEYVWSWAAKPRLIDVTVDDLSTLTMDNVTLAGEYLGQVAVPLTWGDVDYFIGEDGSLNLVTLDTNNGIMLKRIPAEGSNFVKEVANDKLKIYPNPASSELNISHPDGVQQAEILSASGAVVKSVSELSSQTINVDDLTAGVYFVRVKTNAHTVVVSKFVKK